MVNLNLDKERNAILKCIVKIFAMHWLTSHFLLCLLMQVSQSKIIMIFIKYSIQMIGSSNVNIGIIAKNYEFFDDEKANWNLRRNYLLLFDNMKNEVMKLDVSIGVSL